MCHVSCHCFMYSSCFENQLRIALRTGSKFPTTHFLFKESNAAKIAPEFLKNSGLNYRGAHCATGQGLDKGLWPGTKGDFQRSPQQQLFFWFLFSGVPQRCNTGKVKTWPFGSSWVILSLLLPFPDVQLNEGTNTRGPTHHRWKTNVNSPKLSSPDAIAVWAPPPPLGLPSLIPVDFLTANWLTSIQCFPPNLFKCSFFSRNFEQREGCVLVSGCPVDMWSIKLTVVVFFREENMVGILIEPWKTKDQDKVVLSAGVWRRKRQR